MKKLNLLIILAFVFTGIKAQEADPAIIDAIIDETYNNSHLKINAHELLDDIGPRLVGTPQMQQAHDWAVEKYKSWGIHAENHEWGKWRAWERGITHIDMLEPRVQTLAGTQLAWSAATPAGGITAEVVIIPIVKDSFEFQDWLKTIEGKFVMIAMKEPTGRPEHDWKEWATEGSHERIKQERQNRRSAWADNLRRAGVNRWSLASVLEDAGAAGIVDSYWSSAFGTNKIFGARSKTIPTVDIHLEDYTMLFRMCEHGDKPVLRIVAESKDLGEAPAFNTIARIEGSEKPDEYVMLSAHFDSWDGGTGATDNGTGTLLMMEVMRILKKVYPNPKRTILVGHWGSEEQGLNGSASFVEDFPEIVENIHVLFNQDNGTGRIERIDGSGFLHSYDYLGRYLRAVPDTVTEIKTNFPGSPAMGGTDHASFVRAGVPAFNLTALSWSYWNYTWHTNRDTYDKIVWEDLRNNVILTAVLAYMASEDPVKASREQRVVPPNRRTGEPGKWPEPRSPQRAGGLN